MKIYTILCILLGYFALQMSYHRIKNITSTLGDSLYAISAEPAIQERDLRAHITKLAGEIGPRNIEDEAHYQKLDAAATYIEETMQMFGYKPNIYTYDATYKGNQFSVKNIEAVVEGSHPSNGYIVIGAHYDTVAGSSGADDNGSGVAALLEIARHLHSLDKQKIKTTIKLVTFPNEEAPYSLDPKTQKSFSTNMGSVVYAKQAKAKNDTIIGMICLESIGYYSDTPGSQRYPFVLKWLQWFYGNKGNFLMALSDRASKNFLNRFIRVYNQDAHSFPMHANALPNIKLTRDIGRSDHKSFWIEGYPALMLTDTANFRNGHYHEGTDMPDSVNYEALTKVTNQLCLAVERLACE